MARFERHVFVCRNQRAADDPRGCCADKGSELVLDRMKKAVHERGMKGRVRVNQAGCLDQCAQGVSVVVYPEAVWYGRVRPEDVEEIVVRHLAGGEPVERLRTDRPKEPGTP